MKYALIAALMVLGLAAACAGSKDAGQAVHITLARATAPGTCSFNDATIYKERGEYDLRAFDLLGVGGYFQIFSWENTVPTRSIVVGGDTLTDPTTETFYAHQAQLSYSSSDSSVTLPPVTWDLSSTIVAGASGATSQVGVELLPATIPALLAKQLSPGAGPVTLDVKFQIVGEVAGHQVSTSPFTFPLTVFKSATATCTPPYYLTGECGILGKDFPVECSGSADAGVYIP